MSMAAAKSGRCARVRICSQAAAAVRGVPAVLGGLRISQVIAAGQSQSAGRLATYLNGIHDRAPIYDAALLTVNTTPIRAGVSSPVIKVLSENEAATSRNQEDSARIRTWMVAGSTHSEQYSLISRAAFLKRDLNLQAVDACETPARSRVEIRYVYNAAVDALVKWKKAGIAPPSAAPLTFVDNALQRDEHGNARGGIRLAEIAVPVAREIGRSLRSRRHARTVRNRDAQQPVSEPRRVRRQSAHRVRGDGQGRVSPPSRCGADN